MSYDFLLFVQFSSLCIQLLLDPTCSGLSRKPNITVERGFLFLCKKKKMIKTCYRYNILIRMQVSIGVCIYRYEKKVFYIYLYEKNIVFSVIL